ncbi:FAD-dependent oxidoreductase [uncultured Friedmanniella sp.]|uniref:FAD-dependent oxidoreductase n=1 Tax=uncultured Friedmanniella sp. TaxID=335381 RepID=UPI0035CC1D89
MRPGRLVSEHRDWQPGRDARAVRHPAAPGVRRSDGQRPVLVAGGGIAGLAAATGLAERGVPVTLVEAQPQLGGRVRAWPVVHDDGVNGAEVTMSRGFHAFFRQYYNLRGLLRRADPGLDQLVPLEDYPLVLAGGHRDSFATLPRTPPLSVAAFVAQSPSFTLADLSRVDVPAALELLDVDFPDTFSRYDGESAADFLDRLRFPEGARHLALEVFARSFFAHPSEFAAGELVAMFHTYFTGSAEGLLFDVPREDYDTALWAPLGRYLHGLGVQVRTSETVQSVAEGADGQLLVGFGSGEQRAYAGVVVATDLATTRRLVIGSGLVEGRDTDRLAATRKAPPFAVWRLWLDRRAAPERSPFLGTSGFGPLDNISLLERFENGARRWSDASGGSVVELHAYALRPGSDEAGVRAELRQQLDVLYPELEGAGVLAEEWLLSEDCPLAGTAPWQLRPEVTTADPRLVLAGDGIRCDYPVALMERAATTGLLAANALLAAEGVAGHDLWTVPMSSRHPVAGRVRRLLTR